MKLDRIDFGLIRSLREDARISNKELAEANAISASTCLERVRRLRQQGVLTGFHAEVDPQAVGIAVQAMIAVRYSQHHRVSFDAMKAELLQVQEVVTVFFLAGTRDILIHVATRDVDHLRHVCEQFTSRPDVAHIETSLILEYAHSHSLPDFVEE